MGYVTSEGLKSHEIEYTRQYNDNARKLAVQLANRIGIQTEETMIMIMTKHRQLTNKENSNV